MGDIRLKSKTEQTTIAMGIRIYIRPDKPFFTRFMVLLSLLTFAIFLIVTLNTQPEYRNDLTFTIISILTINISLVSMVIAFGSFTASSKPIAFDQEAYKQLFEKPEKTGSTKT